MDGVRVAAAALALLLAACSQRAPVAALGADVAAVPPPAAAAAPALDPLQLALAVCATCAVGESDVDPGCAAVLGWGRVRSSALQRSGGAAAVAEVGRQSLRNPAPAVRLLAARAAALDLPASATALLAQAGAEPDARVLTALWALLRGSAAEPVPDGVRAQAAARLASEASPAVHAAAVEVLDPTQDGPILLAALATATEAARASACEKLFAARPAAMAEATANPLHDPGTPQTVRTACLVGAARAVCALDQGDARPATEAVLAALKAAPPWQLVSALACAKGMSDEARLAFARALRPVVDDEQAAPLARVEAVRTLAAMGAPSAWFGIWRQRYGGAKFGADGLIGVALQGVVR